MSNNKQDQEHIPSMEQEETPDTAIFRSLFEELIGLLAFVMLFCNDEHVVRELEGAMLATVIFGPERQNNNWQDVEHVIDKILSRRSSRVCDLTLPTTFAFMNGGHDTETNNVVATGQEEEERWERLLRYTKQVIHSVAKYDFKRCLAGMSGSPNLIVAVEFIVKALRGALESATKEAQVTQPQPMSSEAENYHDDRLWSATLSDQSAEEATNRIQDYPASPAESVDVIHEQGDALQAIEPTSSEETKHEITPIEIGGSVFLVDDKQSTAETVHTLLSTANTRGDANFITTNDHRIGDWTDAQPTPTSDKSTVVNENELKPSMDESNGGESSSGSSLEKRDEDDETTIVDDVATTPSMEAKSSSSTEQDEESNSAGKTSVDISNVSVYIDNTDTSQDGQPSKVSSLSGSHASNKPGRWDSNASSQNVSPPQNERSTSAPPALLGESASSDDNEVFLSLSVLQPALSPNVSPPRKPLSSYQQDASEETTSNAENDAGDAKETTNNNAENDDGDAKETTKNTETDVGDAEETTKHAGTDVGDTVVVIRRQDSAGCWRKCQEACQIL